MEWRSIFGNRRSKDPGAQTHHRIEVRGERVLDGPLMTPERLHGKRVIAYEETLIGTHVIKITRHLEGGGKDHEHLFSLIRVDKPHPWKVGDGKRMMVEVFGREDEWSQAGLAQLSCAVRDFRDRKASCQTSGIAFGIPQAMPHLVSYVHDGPSYFSEIPLERRMELFNALAERYHQFEAELNDWYEKMNG